MMVIVKEIHKMERNVVHHCQLIATEIDFRGWLKEVGHNDWR